VRLSQYCRYRGSNNCIILNPTIPTSYKKEVVRKEYINVSSEVANPVFDVKKM
jgi:hypothetical protein